MILVHDFSSSSDIFLSQSFLNLILNLSLSWNLDLNLNGSWSESSRTKNFQKFEL